jgi:hypothetical protein
MFAPGKGPSSLDTIPFIVRSCAVSVVWLKDVLNENKAIIKIITKPKVEFFLVCVKVCVFIFSKFYLPLSYRLWLKI